MKRLIFLGLMSCFSFPSFAIENCYTYQDKIVVLKMEIQGLMIQIGQARDFVESNNSGSTNTGELVQQRRDSLYTQISQKEKEIETMKSKYDTCWINNDKERLAEDVARKAQISENIKKTQEQDAYYAQKAKEDTIKLQAQIEAEKKAKITEGLKAKRLAKIEANKKRIAEARKKVQERAKQLREFRQKNKISSGSLLQ